MESLTTIPTVNHKMQILLVEDKHEDQRMVALGLKGFDLPHELTILGDGKLALNFLKKINPYTDAPRPDLLLLDWHLPGKNGEEVLLEMRQDPTLRDIPVVVLTGFDTFSSNRNPYEAGANLIVTKPNSLHLYTEFLWFVIESFQKGTLPPTRPSES